MRIDRFFTDNGICSRRGADKLIAAGLSINGVPAKIPPRCAYATPLDLATRRGHRRPMPAAADPVTTRRVRLDEILTLRHTELRPGRPLSTAMFDADVYSTTRHFGAFTTDDTPVGCVSFMEAPYEGQRAWQLRGMATRADRVRRGVGARLLAHALPALAAEFGPRPVWCNARTSAIAFYESQGLHVVSAEFNVPDIGPHVVMLRRA